MTATSVMELLIVPSDPYWQPTRTAADDGVSFLTVRYPDADGISSSFLEEVGFHHPFECWDGVSCPACKNDVEAWFFPELNRIYELNRLRDMRTATPCCGIQTTLDSLDFPGLALFGSFLFEILNPNREALTGSELRELSLCVGSDLRMLWRRI